MRWIWNDDTNNLYKLVELVKSINLMKHKFSEAPGNRLGILDGARKTDYEIA